MCDLARGQKLFDFFSVVPSPVARSRGTQKINVSVLNRSEQAGTPQIRCLLDAVELSVIMKLILITDTIIYHSS